MNGAGGLSDKVGLYMRLSRDDERAGESMSIDHQRSILTKYVADNGGAVAGEYVDDGFSGTNFDRPGVTRLLFDAQSGKIDTIVVKDLSRFGRNYIRVGQYVDYIFPAYGVRFIALGDNVDTADRGSAAMDMMPIMNVFNEWHAASTGKKIRAVFEASRRAGKYVGWSYPYGYRAGGDDKRTAVVDEAAAEVVRRIFDLRLRGSSAGTIARILTSEGVPSPAAYYARLGGKPERERSPLWGPRTVRRILSDPTYLGCMTQHKTARVSYKNRRLVPVPESEWAVVEGAHEPIVTREVWLDVQATFASGRGRPDKTGRLHALSGLVVCHDCGKRLKLKSTGNARASFVCRTYVELGKRFCSAHRIAEETLESAVLDDIRSLAGVVELDEGKAKARFLRERSKRGESGRTADERQLKAYRGRLAELDRLLQAAFEEKVLGNLPEDILASLCEKYRSERETIMKAQRELEERLSERNNDDENAEEYVKKLRRYVACENLTREMCLCLIDRITVGERTETGEREIHIYYKFRAAENAPVP